MYAYVKLIEGPNRGKKIIVRISEIRNFSINTKTMLSIAWR